MTQITMTNDFHGTTVTMRPDAQGRLTDAQVYRAQRVLCGMSDCACSGWLGARGDQPDSGLEVQQITSSAEQRGGYAARVIQHDPICGICGGDHARMDCNA